MLHSRKGHDGRAHGGRDHERNQHQESEKFLDAGIGVQALGGELIIGVVVYNSSRKPF